MFEKMTKKNRKRGPYWPIFKKYYFCTRNRQRAAVRGGRPNPGYEGTPSPDVLMRWQRSMPNNVVQRRQNVDLFRTATMTPSTGRRQLDEQSRFKWETDVWHLGDRRYDLVVQPDFHWLNSFATILSEFHWQKMVQWPILNNWVPGVVLQKG